MRKTKKRDDNLAALVASITQLIDRVEADTVHTRDQGVGEDGVRRPRVEGVTYRVTEPGLLRQLVVALVPSSPMVGEPVTRMKPRPRTPSQAHIAGVLATIGKEVETLREEMRAAAERSAPRGVGRRTVRSDLLEIRSLAFGCDSKMVAQAARKAAEWVSMARVALTWDAPVVALRDASCPYCGGVLQVRGDAESDVWCAGSPAAPGVERQPPCRDEEGVRRTWPRSSWIMLLERLNRQEEEVAG